MAAGDAYARVSGFPAIPGIGFSFANADGASVAYVVQQRQFRARFLCFTALFRVRKFLQKVIVSFGRARGVA